MRMAATRGCHGERQRCEPCDSCLPRRHGHTRRGAARIVPWTSISLSQRLQLRPAVPQSARPCRSGSSQNTILRISRPARRQWQVQAAQGQRIRIASRGRHPGSTPGADSEPPRACRRRTTRPWAESDMHTATQEQQASPREATAKLMPVPRRPAADCSNGRVGTEAVMAQGRRQERRADSRASGGGKWPRIDPISRTR